ncbi:MAG: hypothetical protein QY326_04140 [Bdellovibrionota bacterium]|nr:MAG: hypothetical protein QY326_04140 [Bdellovibrionota bacterium]
MRASCRYLSLFLCCLFLTAPSFTQAESKGQCIKQATKERNACRDECNRIREQQRTGCLVPPTECGDVCAAAYDACLAPLNLQKDDCRESCNDTYDAARDACAATCACSIGTDCNNNACFGVCVDAAAIDRSECTTACYRNPEFRNGVKECAREANRCGKDCKRDDDSSSSSDDDGSSSSTSDDGSSSSSDDSSSSTSDD